MILRRSLAATGLLLVAAMSWSQNAGENLGKHDLNGQSCAACHVGQSATPPDSPRENSCDKTALWDCELFNRTFASYDAPLPGGKTAAQALDETQVRMSSLLCASCHDGVSTLTMSGAAGFSTRSSSAAARGLRNEHPIDVAHDPAKDPTLATLNMVSKQVKLFGHGNRVQCATCHNVHDSSDPKLLRMPNQNSALCLTCHL